MAIPDQTAAAAARPFAMVGARAGHALQLCSIAGAFVFLFAVVVGVI